MTAIHDNTFSSQVTYYLGIDYCLPYWKGRVALYAILEALNLQAGDEVILPGFTCVAAPNALQYRGVTPVYVDIDETTYTIDPSLIEEKITPRTRAVIIQNTFGLAPDYDAILPIAWRRGLTVIEDAAHGFGALYKGKPAGSLADAAFFSTQWNKPFSTGIGGFAVTNDPAIGEKLRANLIHYTRPTLFERLLLRAELTAHAHLLTPSLYWPAVSVYRALTHRGLIPGSSSRHELAGRMPPDFKKGFSPVQAKWAARALADVDAVLKHRKDVAGRYDAMMDDLGMQKPARPEYAEHSFLRYPALARDRASLLAEARRRRIEIGDWFNCVLHPRGPALETFGYKAGACPVGERVAARIINLPTHPKINEKEIQRMYNFLKDMRVKGYL